MLGSIWVAVLTGALDRCRIELTSLRVMYSTVTKSTLPITVRPSLPALPDFARTSLMRVPSVTFGGHRVGGSSLCGSAATNEVVATLSTALATLTLLPFACICRITTCAHTYARRGR